MDRCAVFVDAGYLYAAGGLLCCDTRERRRLHVDAQGIVDLLAGVAQARSGGLSLLRTYWYDAAFQRIRDADQDEIAALPNVKLRLGKLVDSKQKGVDVLVYRDLITLAQNRAISDALLLAGDEDLREGVRLVQEMGVRVVVAGIASSDDEPNQSPDLLNEADETLELDETDLSGLIHLDHDLTDAIAAAAEFARTWGAEVSYEELANAHASRPYIPKWVDSRLLQAVSFAIDKEVPDNYKYLIRSSFWDSLQPL